MIGWLYTPLGCIADGQPGGCTRGVSAERFETPSCGGSRPLLAAWGEPARPGFPPEGETGKGESNSLLPQAIYRGSYTRVRLVRRSPASPYSHSKAGIPKKETGMRIEAVLIGGILVVAAAGLTLFFLARRLPMQDAAIRLIAAEGRPRREPGPLFGHGPSWRSTWPERAA